MGAQSNDPERLTMSNTRKHLPATRPSRPTTVGLEPPRCECRHGDEPDGCCTGSATSRASVLCQVEHCNCAAAVYLVCTECLTIWQTNAKLDRIALQVRGL